MPILERHRPLNIVRYNFGTFLSISIRTKLSSIVSQPKEVVFVVDVVFVFGYVVVLIVGPNLNLKFR